MVTLLYVSKNLKSLTLDALCETFFFASTIFVGVRMQWEPYENFVSCLLDVTEPRENFVSYTLHVSETPENLLTLQNLTKKVLSVPNAHKS